MDTQHSASRIVFDTTKKIVVAMSGGVDSSVAAYLLKQSGYDLVGVSMQVWDYRRNGGSKSRASCCAPDDFNDARDVAGKLDIPFYVFDFEKTFEDNVIKNFVDSYSSGRTPNPCIECNSKVKFNELRNRARSIGRDYLATGHYAQIIEESGEYKLLRAKDLDKDQSYFLYRLRRDELSKVLFPVGCFSKSEVRCLARQAGLVTADKAESQDICFVSGKVTDFLVKLGSKSKRGLITDKNGSVLGEHDGIQNYTVGQRRGLSVSGSKQALYIVELDPDNNRVVMGERKELQRESFSVSDLNWISEDYEKLSPGEEFLAMAQLRHRHAGVRVKVKKIDTDLIKVHFVEQWSTVTPGQAAVLYDLSNKQVLGGGSIMRDSASL